MKKTQKALLLMLCAVLLVVTTVFTTIAFLTDNDSVVNTFTIGKVDITLDEAKVTSAGVVDGNDRVKENNYKLMPGHTYTKDPTVHVQSGSEDCYLFVKVENGISAIEDSTINISAQMAAKGWLALGGDNANIYVYVGIEANATAPKSAHAGDDVVVFEQFKVKENVTDFSNYSNAQIAITAYAVQADSFAGKTATEIWNAAFGNN